MALNISRDRYYHLRNKHSDKVIGIGGDHKQESGQHLIQWNSEGVPDQTWAIFQLDGGLSVLANQLSGYVMAVGYPNMANGAPLIQWEWVDADDQKWSFVPVEGEYYRLLNQKNGRVVGVAGGQSNRDNGQKLIVWDAGAEDQLWRLEPATTFSLPSFKTELLSDIPRFTTHGQNLSDTTEKVITAYTLLPCVMVGDSWEIEKKIRDTPYYALVKREYWRKEFQEDIAAHGSIEKKEKFGMRIVDQQTMEEKTGISVKADAGFAFKGFSASISTTVTHELGVTHSTTSESMKENEVTRKYDNPTANNVSYAKYSRVIEYTLQRANGMPVASPWSVVRKDDTRTTTWPTSTEIPIKDHAETLIYQ